MEGEEEVWEKEGNEESVGGKQEIRRRMKKRKDETESDEDV